MADESDDDAGQRPRFRGCVFCYAGEWSYYGAKQAVRRVRSGDRA